MGRDGDNAPVGLGPDQPAGPLRQQQGGVGRRDRHKPVSASTICGARSRRHERVVGPRERDSVDDHQLARLAGQIEALPERESAKQTDCGVGDKLSLEVRELAVALAEDRQVRERLAYLLGRGFGCSPRRE